MEAVTLHNIVVNTEDLRMPIHLSDQLTGSELTADVKQSIMELLQGPSSKTIALPSSSLQSVSSAPIQMWVSIVPFAMPDFFILNTQYTRCLCTAVCNYI